MFVLVHLVSCRFPIGDQTQTQIGDYPTKPRRVKLLTANRPHRALLWSQQMGTQRAELENDNMYY